MQIVLLLVVALAAGYFGGYLALVHARRQEKVELRGVVDELLSELQLTAEESCGRLIRERSQLEQLARTIKENAAMAVHTEDAVDSTQVLVSTAQTDTPPLQAGSYLRSKVKFLADQGKDCAQIAKELNLGRGEVELILKVSESNLLR